MWVRNKSIIEKLKDQPIPNKNYNDWSKRYYRCSNIWKIGSYIVKNNIGKSRDLAFSYFVKKYKLVKDYTYPAEYIFERCFQSNHKVIGGIIVEEKKETTKKQVRDYMWYRKQAEKAKQEKKDKKLKSKERDGKFKIKRERLDYEEDLNSFRPNTSIMFSEDEDNFTE